VQKLFLQFSYNSSYLFIVFLSSFWTVVSFLDIRYTRGFSFWKMLCKLCYNHSRYGCNWL